MNIKNLGTMKKIFTIFIVLATLSVSNAFSQKNNLDSGLVAYYPFSGNANDSSGNGHHAAVYGPATLTKDRFGNETSAYRFNGTTDYIECNTIPVLDSVLTYAAWIKVTRLAGTDMNNNFACFGTVGGGLASWDWAYNANNQLFWVYDQTNSTQSYTAVIDTAWKFVVVKYDGLTRSVYLDTVLLGVTDSIVTPIYTAATDVLRIGAHTNGSQYFQGSIDDVRLYRCALTTEEIQELFLVGGWVGIPADEKMDMNIRLYPNPATDKVYVESERLVQITVYDITGKQIFSGNSRDCSQVSLNRKGLYLFSLTSGSNTYCKKVIVR